MIICSALQKDIKKAQRILVEWQPDMEATSCNVCESPFIRYINLPRKHHCRVCGFVICGRSTCSKFINPCNMTTTITENIGPENCNTRCEISNGNDNIGANDGAISGATAISSGDERGAKSSADRCVLHTSSNSIRKIRLCSPCLLRIELFQFDKNILLPFVQLYRLSRKIRSPLEECKLEYEAILGKTE